MSEGMLDMALRVQPWKSSNHNIRGDYHDFRKNPKLIRTNLEEYLPFSKYAGVGDFYNLLEWLNGPKSAFETNDARLMSHLSRNNQRDLADKDFVSVGVLGFFFRDLLLNLSNESQFWSRLWETHQIDEEGFRISPNPLCQNFITRFLKTVERSTGGGWPQIIGIGTAPVHYDLAPVAAAEKYGCQFMLRFWLWGNSEDEIFDGLRTVVSILRIALPKSAP